MLLIEIDRHVLCRYVISLKKGIKSGLLGLQYKIETNE